MPPRIAVGQTAQEDRHAFVRLLLAHRHHALMLNSDFASGHAYQLAQRGHPGQQEVGEIVVSSQMFERSSALGLADMWVVVRVSTPTSSIGRWRLSICALPEASSPKVRNEPGRAGYDAWN
jgi:hypothetical protein